MMWIAAARHVQSTRQVGDEGRCITWKEVRPGQGQDQCYIAENVEELGVRRGEGEDNDS